MAKRVAPTTAPAETTAAQDQAAVELGILHPERVPTIAGRALVVREYGYLEGLRLVGSIKPFLDGLHVVFARARSLPTVDAIVDVIADNVDLVQALIAQAITPVDADQQRFAAAIAENAIWMETLSEPDGDLLMLCWWGANGPFFTRRLMRRAVEEKAKVNLSAGPDSTQP